MMPQVCRNALTLFLKIVIYRFKRLNYGKPPHDPWCFINFDPHSTIQFETGYKITQRIFSENGLPPRTSYIIDDSEGQNLKDTESTKRWSAFNAEFERIEREDRDIRIRLSNLYNDAPLSATKTQTTNRQYEEDRREKLELLNLPTKTKSKVC